MQNQPDRIFIGITPSHQRKFLVAALTHLKNKGYRDVVIPTAGQFTVVKIAIEVGFEPQRIKASDIGLFSSALGYFYAGRPVDSLGFTLAEKIYLPGRPAEEVASTYAKIQSESEKLAYLLWLVKLRQLERDIRRYREKMMLADMLANREKHLGVIARDLEKCAKQYAGINYEVRDLRKVIDDPQTPETVMLVDAPSYKGGYRRMFPLEGLIDFDPHVELCDMKKEHVGLYEKTRALEIPVFWYWYETAKEVDPGDVVFAQEYSEKRYDYWLCTKPHMLDDCDSKSAIVFKKPTDLKPYKNLPHWGPDDEIRHDSKIAFVCVDKNFALYYRELWAHKLPSSSCDNCYLVLVDGKILGTVGLMMRDVMRMKDERAGVVFAFTAPSNRYPNINRLLLYLITAREFRDVIVSSASKINRLYTLLGLGTTCFSKYRHVKLNSDLFKLILREKKPNGFYRLRYVCDFRPATLQQSLFEYLEEFKRKYAPQFGESDEDSGPGQRAVDLESSPGLHTGAGQERPGDDAGEVQPAG